MRDGVLDAHLTHCHRGGTSQPLRAVVDREGFVLGDVLFERGIDGLLIRLIVREILGVFFLEPVRVRERCQHSIDFFFDVFLPRRAVLCPFAHAVNEIAGVLDCV